MLLRHYFTRFYFIFFFLSFQFFGLNASWIPRFFIKKEQIKTNKTYDLSNNIAIKIKNINGSITIKENSEPQLELETVKSGTEQELKNSEVSVKIKPNEIFIFAEKKTEDYANIDLVIKIPKENNIKLIQTDQGSIIVENFNGSIGNIIIDKGNLTLISPSQINSININNGNIIINNPKINLQNIIVDKGNIEIFDSTNSVIAKTNIGHIKLKQKIFKEPNTIFLETNKGNISLNLPPKLQAHIRFRTLKGIINSVYPITFKSITMKLNDDNWGQLKKNIEGIIGNGGAPITLDVSKGNILLDIY